MQTPLYPRPPGRDSPGAAISNGTHKLEIEYHNSIKGIVSREWGGLQTILLDRLEVFNISASWLFLFVSAFSYRIFKNGRLSGASFQHNF